MQSLKVECTAPECAALRITLKVTAEHNASLAAEIAKKEDALAERETELLSLRMTVSEQFEALEGKEIEISSLKTTVGEQSEELKKLKKREITLADMESKMGTLCEGELEALRYFFSLSLLRP